MSTTGITHSMISLLQSSRSGGSLQSGIAAQGLGKAPPAGEFSALLARQMASSRMSALVSLFHDGAANADLLSGTRSAPGISGDLFSLPALSLSDSREIQGLSPSGRNLSLSDPESGYRLMSTINSLDLTYKAQFAELSEMRSRIAGMERAGEDLAGVDSAMDGAGIKAKVHEFVGKYNEWIGRSDASIKRDGVLAGSWTAETALYELEQNVESIFNGAADGIAGLRELGLSIDQATNLLAVDATRLDAALTGNKAGVVNALDQFSANFVKSAELLNAADNVIPRQLANLDRVIDYISDHLSALRQEFGSGDPARPSESVSKALAAYRRMVSGG